MISDLRQKLLWFPLLRLIPDKSYLQLKYYLKFHKKIDFKNPKDMNEKINWLKLYNRNPFYTKLADKYEVKKYVESLIGSEHIIKTYGVWNSFDEIDFPSLPRQFVLKCTHDSGSFYIVKDKNNFDMKAAKRKLESGRRKNYFWPEREWVYKDIKPRIIAEEYIEQLGKPESIEYKVSCFDGKVGFVTICTGIAHSDFDKRFNDHFDKDFNKLPWYVYYKPAKVTPEKPKAWNELISICEKLSEDMPYVRIDTYIINGRILFGEMTFYTWGGYMPFEPLEWNEKLGEMINLDTVKI